MARLVLALCCPDRSGIGVENEGEPCETFMVPLTAGDGGHGCTVRHDPHLP